jgi:hypothetical protein
MIAKVISCCVALIFGASALAAATPPAAAATPPAAAAAPPALTAKFDAATAYGVPGVVLPAGSFTISVLDHLSDRYIVQVKDQAGDVLATFLGLPSKAPGKPADGKVSWASGPKGVSYLKGWNFRPAGVNLEFVYPKDDAVAIAQANNTAVAAIDPASDGLLTAHPKDLSPQVLQIVTLWLLTPTRVGANHAAGITAKRYAQAVPAAPVVASGAPEAGAGAPVPPANQVASVDPHRRPALRAMHALPHTASDLGWFYLVGMIALVGAAGLRALAVRAGVASAARDGVL